MEAEKTGGHGGRHTAVRASGARPLRDTAWQLLREVTVPSMHSPDVRIPVPPSIASPREVKAGVQLALHSAFMAALSVAAPDR